MSALHPKTPNLDSLTSVNADGTRYVIHPADVKGRFRQWRTILGWILIALFVALPWIPINGYPAVFLDFVNQRFHLFGATLAFQDTWLLFFVVTGLAFSIFFVTALFGRVWCGWACPQTVYLDLVYRRIERLIEGDATARRRLDASPWTPEKAIKRISKHLLFLLCSALIVHIFLSYIVSLPGLWSMMLSSPLQNWAAFLFVLIATAILYFNFAWFREQLCIVICPYGRLQGALIDDHSLNVAYDATRGEPRGKASDPNAGDCVDCHRCVQVCPTGIDIRQGLQLECVGCTACIDACDDIMDKLKRPRGLIRYASNEELEGRQSRLIRPRTLVYTAFLLVGMIVAAFSVASVQPAEVSIVRSTGMPFFVTETSVRNQFTVRLVNKSSETMSFTLRTTTDAPFPIEVGGDRVIEVAPMEEVVTALVVQIPRDHFDGRFPLKLVVTNDSPRVEIVRTVEFLGPDPGLLRSR